MKKIFLLIAMTFAIVNSGSAQCTPDTSITHNVPGIYPDTLVGLPHSYVGVPYMTDIQVKVFTNTTYMGVPATIDSLVVISVAGLPPGFGYSNTPSSGVFPGGSDACILLSGAAPSAGGAADRADYAIGLSRQGKGAKHRRPWPRSDDRHLEAG